MVAAARSTVTVQMRHQAAQLLRSSGGALVRGLRDGAVGTARLRH